MGRIADRVNVDAIYFEKTVHSKTDKAVVTFAPSTGTLAFNPKMVKLLNMEDWKQVLVGYDKSSKVIVLKQCDAEEYGAVVIRIPAPSRRDGKYKERAKKCRVIGIKHLVKSLALSVAKRFKGERDGTMIFLEDLNQNK